MEAGGPTVVYAPKAFMTTLLADAEHPYLT
jgi:hypothetical protein